MPSVLPPDIAMMMTAIFCGILVGVVLATLMLEQARRDR